MLDLNSKKLINLKKALIVGVSGQDGSLLANYLLSKGYKVFGSSRDSQSNSFNNLKLLGILSEVEKISVSINDFRSVISAINRIKPDEIYNLAGQTSVSLSFQQPVETIESIVLGNLNLLEAIRLSNLPIKFYNAGSSEMFGDLIKPANETTRLSPKSPYGVAKSAAFFQVVNYREAYGINASTGILFNHESPLRKKHFVTAKIVHAVCDIHMKKRKKLQLGNLKIVRDWGWAPQYVEAMWKMLQIDNPSDFIIGTGISLSLEKFVKIAFNYFNLNWEDFVEKDDQLLRPSDISCGYSDPSKAKELLKWEAELKGENLIYKLIESHLNSTIL